MFHSTGYEAVRSKVICTSIKFMNHKRIINRYLNKWTTIFDLKPPHWKVEICYMDTPSPRDSDNHVTHAECTVRWEYCIAQIVFWMPTIIKDFDRHGKEDWIQELVVHELCHILTGMMHYTTIDDQKLLEYTVTKLTKTFLKLG